MYSPPTHVQTSTRATSEAVTKAHHSPDLGIYPLSISEGLSRTWEIQIIEQRRLRHLTSKSLSRKFVA